MAHVSISEAARLTGKSRATIHRHIEKGKLSKGDDGSGNPTIDISELERVYGTIQVKQVSQTVSSDNLRQGGPVAESGAIKAEIEMIREQLRRADEMHERERQSLSRQIEDLRSDRDQWREQADKWQEQAKTTTRLLEDHRQQGSRGFWFRLFGGQRA